jgi:hypothetical protein
MNCTMGVKLGGDGIMERQREEKSALKRKWLIAHNVSWKF